MNKKDFFSLFIILKKNWLIQKRNIKDFLIEFLTSFFAVYFVVMNIKIPDTHYEDTKTNETLELKPELDYLVFRPMHIDKLVLAYCPDNTKVQSIMRAVSTSLNFNFTQEYGFKNEKDLEISLTNSNEAYGAIVFLRSSFVNNDLAQDVHYKIRLRPEGSKAWKEERKVKHNIWKTDVMMPDFDSNLPMKYVHSKFYSKEKPKYKEEGFLGIQEAVDMAIISNLGGDVSNVTSFLQKFPRPKQKIDDFIHVRELIVGLVFTFIFAFRISYMCNEITYEKEKKLKEAMKLMGLKAWVNWMGWIVKYTIIMFVITIFMTIFLHIKLGESALFEYTCPTITFLFILLTSLEVVVYCCFISTLFNKATTASGVGLAIFMGTYIPNQYHLEIIGKRDIFLHLVLNLQFLYGVRIIAAFEKLELGMQWKYLFLPLPGNVSMAGVFFAQIIYLILFGFLTWYIDAVRPGEFGVPQKWNFFLTKEYWSKSLGSSSMFSRSRSQLWKERVDYKEESSFFQEFPKDIRMGIKIRNITKVFGDNKIKSVDDLSMDIKEGDITVILGHNGAGKTTLISMLTGFFPPTSGAATINSLSITTEMEMIRKSMGLCPQFNILFDYLTVQEHFEFYSKLKGCSKESTASEMEVLLEKLNLKDKRHTFPQNLSGGMQRKLSVGIALIGGSKIVFLDEPSSGLDPEARRELWDLLKSQRAGRTMILTTHYMDEAEFLGDRIAIMSAGELVCYGSPMFLKNKYGVGYSLRVVLTDPSKYSELERYVIKSIPGANLNNSSALEVNFTLPKSATGEFSKLFSSFETDGAKYGVRSFGVSDTTIEEVFLKIGELGRGRLDTVDESARQTSRFKRMRRNPNFVQQLQAVLVKNKLNFTRNKKMSLFAISVPIITSLVFILLSIYSSTRSKKQIFESREKIHSLALNLDHYPDPVTVISLAPDYDPSSNRSACLKAVVSQYKGSTVFLEDYDKGNISEYLLKVAEKDFNMRIRYQVAGVVGKDMFLGLYNEQSFHSIATSLSMVNNAWLKCLLGNSSKKHNILTINHPLPFATRSNIISDANEKKEKNKMITAGWFPNIFLFMLVSYCIFPIQEKTSGSKINQLISGLVFTVYWLGAFLFDFLLYFIMVFLVFTSFYFHFPSESPEARLFWYVIALMLLYGWAIIPLVYLLSRTISKAHEGISWITLALVLMELASNLLAQYLMRTRIQEGGEEKKERYDTMISAVVPQYCIEMGINTTYNTYIKTQMCSMVAEQVDLTQLCLEENTRNDTCCSEHCGLECHAMYFLATQGLVFFFIIFFFESSFFHRLKSLLCKRSVKVILHGEEDDDVSKERLEVLNLPPDRKNVMVVKELYKKYGKLQTVNNLNLKIEKREVFGLLGINGAGKTSTFKMLTGIESITAGSVTINEIDIEKKMTEARKYMGYCPQFDALIEHMTPKETLVYYARLKGVPSAHIEALTEELIKNFLLREHKNKLSRNLSGGNKRKLSIAIAVMCAPVMVFLDEPTAGMDPASKRKVWNCIGRLKDSDSTVVITSHSMEECEALCTRLAIMVDGQFKCLGSTQHLKNKFGLDITVRFKLFDTKHAAGLHTFMAKNYPGSGFEEESNDEITYKISKKLPNAMMSKIFDLLEKNKNNLSLKDYTVSQSTLEQVFINFANRKKGQDA